MSVHARIHEYDGSFRCLDCGEAWGELPGRPSEPDHCTPTTCPTCGALRGWSHGAVDCFATFRAQLAAALSRAEQAEREREALIAAIRDIDAHATPYGMANDGTDNPQAYLVTVGALHRALGAAEGRATAAPCPCRLTSPERLREIAEEIGDLCGMDGLEIMAALAILTAQLTDKKEG